MDVQEKWSEIEEFPGYRVSDRGRVASDKTGHILSLNYNQAGIANAALFFDGQVYRRSVSLLVAQTFLPPPTLKHYDTPIHLDGDKTNNAVTNLMWRPRWFAIKYQQQFLKAPAVWKNMPVRVPSTGEEFKHAIDLCSTYGVLIRDVVHAVHNPEKRVPFGNIEVDFV